MQPIVDICESPIFIVGAPRSGTTILAWALARHSRLWTSGESYVPWEFFGSPRAVQCVNALMQSAEVLGQGSWLTRESVGRDELLSYLGLGINALYTSRSGGRRWIDHTPVQSLMIADLSKLFPRALFLHAMRDGREVVSSMIHFLNALEPEVRANFDAAGWTIPWLDFTVACQTWRRYTEAVLDFADANPGRCHTVNHAEFVQDPDTGFGKVFRFLDVPFEDAPVTSVRTERLHSSFRAPIARAVQRASGQKDVWSSWDDGQRATFWREAGALMRRCGFAVDAKSRTT